MSTSTTHYGLRCVDPQVLAIPGAFKFNNTSTPTVVQGNGFTVARSTTGTHTITLDDSFVEVISVVATVELDDSTTALGHPTVVRSSTSSNVITVEYVTDDGDGTGTIEDLAAGSNNGNWCHFVIFVRRTGVRSTAG